jgi:vacuolar-type H+-ATPase subunit I/STV1
MSKIMKLVVWLAFNKITPLPQHIKPIVKTLVFYAFFLGFILTNIAFGLLLLILGFFN